MHWRSLACLAAVASPLHPTQAQALTPVESKLVERVNSRMNDQVAALQKVVDIDSGTLNPAGVREVGRYFETELQGLGFRTRWVSMPETMHRGGHLIAEHIASGGHGQRILLLGHLDTVFEGQGHRFQKSGERAKGAGTIDMKGGDIVILYALKALQDSKVLEGTTVRIVLTGDEENVGVPSSVSRRDVLEAARQSDVVLSFEPDTGKAVIGRRGLSTWSLQVTGVQGHSALVLREKGGAGAVYEAARILDEVRRAYTGHPTITINPGLILGGTAVSYDDTRAAGTAAGKFNIVAPTVLAKGDVRFLSDAERDGAKARMREIASSNLPKTSARIDFEDMAPGWPASAGNQKLLSQVADVSRALGMGPVDAEDPVNRGFGDVNFIGRTAAGIDGLGVKGEGFHGPDESVDLNSLGPATSRAALLIYRLTHQGHP
jgi:glutamate carboxypeptidase